MTITYRVTELFGARYSILQASTDCIAGAPRHHCERLIPARLIAFHVVPLLKAIRKLVATVKRGPLAQFGSGVASLGTACTNLTNPATEQA